MAIFAGVCLSFPFFKMEKKHVENPSVFSLYVLQTGVYSSYENALKEKERIMNAVIFPDGDIYRVLVGASLNEVGLLKIENVLKEEGIHYYKKEISLLQSDSKLFSQYNLMLEKAESKESILLLNQKILEKMVY